MDDQENANAPVAKTSAAWLWKVVKFESLSIMVLLFALFYSNGYAYLETYYGALGAPINRLGFDTYQFVVFGGMDMLVKISASLIACSAVASFVCLMYFTENPDRVFPTTTLAPTTARYRFLQHMGKSYTRAKPLILGTFLLTFLAIATWALWTLTFSQSIERGKLRAYEEIRDCKPETVQLKNLDRITGCIVGESDDMLYLVEKHKESAEIMYEKRQVSKDSIKSTNGPQLTLKRPG